MTKSKIFLVKRSLLEKAFMEKITNELYKDGRIAIDNAGTCGWVERTVLDFFNECFSQKNSVELSPSLEQFLLEMDRIYKHQAIKKGDSWKDCDIRFLVGKLLEEEKEFEQNPKDRSELVDIALVCMMLWHRLEEGKVEVSGENRRLSADVQKLRESVK